MNNDIIENVSSNKDYYLLEVKIIINDKVIIYDIINDINRELRNIQKEVVDKKYKKVLKKKNNKIFIIPLKLINTKDYSSVLELSKELMNQILLSDIYRKKKVKTYNRFLEKIKKGNLK